MLTLNEGVMGRANLFDLAHHTMRFTPDGSSYRIANVPWQWDSDFGSELVGSQANLTGFTFPFSGQSWNALSVGMTGTITFGKPVVVAGRRQRGGFSVDRFAQLQEAGSTLINTVPAISVFFKPRVSGTRYFKQFADRAVITWSVTEPYGGIQDWTWKPTVNRFQATLRKDGTIDLAYDEVAAEDAIIGVYPMITKGVEKPIATFAAGENPAVPSHLDLTRITLSAVDGLFLKATLNTRGPLLPENDPRIDGATYRVCLSNKPITECTQAEHAAILWTVRGGHDWWSETGAEKGFHYHAFGTGVSPRVKVDGDTLSIQGTLPPELKAGNQVFISAATDSPSGVMDRMPQQLVKLSGLRSPEVDLSVLKKTDGPFPLAYEAFHYMSPPRATDLTCTVIRALGDKFDMLAYYSDFRIDNPEAGTSSDGPLGGGPAGGSVTGIGANQSGLSDYCTQGRFQWQFIQPVYVAANQMQEYPPDDVSEASNHDIGAYLHQLAERTSNGKIPPYDYAISQIAHEMGHRWAAFVSAKVDEETIPLGPTHWARGLQAAVAFPYQRPVEASIMGGGVWQDNFDGTYTQLDDDYYVPATGWSYLDLYLMGLITPSEVPDFFLLRNLAGTAKDANGHPVFRADRIKVRIGDVISVEGPRLPDVDHSQKKFNTGMVVVVEHGKTPSKDLIERTNGIRLRWMDYWETTTGHRSSMTTSPQ